RKLPLNDSEYAIASSLKRNYAKHSIKRFLADAADNGGYFHCHHLNQMGSNGKEQVGAITV
ncbi:hypothetical protein ACTHSJ_32980, partial [Paenibacillus cellulositrophicus]|uniref:hypothetical protein n=1 Tax=Paenibacillus cellulositrophicus TaxID=562959 RepID=UPI003F7EDAEC